MMPANDVFTMSDQLPPTTESPTPSEPKETTSPRTPNINDLKDSGQKLLNQINQFGMNVKLLLGGAVLTFIATFFPAYGFEAPYYTTSFSNFADLGWLSWLAALLVILMIVLPLLQVKLPLPWPQALVHLIVSIVGLAAAVIQLITYLFDGTPWGGPQIGIFLVLLGTIIMTYSAYNEQKTPPSSTQEPTQPTNS